MSVDSTNGTAGGTEDAAEPNSGSTLSARTAEMLGGKEVLGFKIDSMFDAHEVIVRGMPNQALQHLVDGLQVLDPRTSVERGIGTSYRTFERSRVSPEKTLSAGLAGRTWEFAKILASATFVFGTQAEAEQWLDSPALALNQTRPIDLLGTPAGVGLVEDLLGRIQYGVYT
jgi:putative toxin-antitoxin system antitoxin component (TIGR02293 family)